MLLVVLETFFLKLRPLLSAQGSKWHRPSSELPIRDTCIFTLFHAPPFAFTFPGTMFSPAKIQLLRLSVSSRYPSVVRNLRS